MSALRALALLVPIASCTSTQQATVLQFGAMRQVMREGQVEPRVRLSDLDIAPSTIGIGAVAGLQGEITIVDGVAHIATAPDLSMRSEPASIDAQATLLTVATPTEVEELTCAEELDETRLSQLLRAHAANGFATVDILGVAESLSMHVARGACPHGVTTKDTEPLRYSAQPGDRLRLVGFYAPDRAGTLTHHGTNFHLHATQVGKNGAPASGHVDAFVLRSGAIVRIGRCSPPR